MQVKMNIFSRKKYFFQPIDKWRKVEYNKYVHLCIF